MRAVLTAMGLALPPKRGVDALAGLTHGLVGQADDEEIGQAAGDLHLYLDTLGIDAGEGEAVDAGDGHGAPVKIVVRLRGDVRNVQ